MNSNEADYLVLQRRAWDQVTELAFSFIGHEFRGAQLVILDNKQAQLSHTFYITNKGVFVPKEGGQSNQQSPKVDVDKLIGQLTASETRSEPLRINQLLREITIPSSDGI